MLKALKIFKKIAVVLIIIIFFAVILSQGKIYKKTETSYGVTFSKQYAEYLGLDWKKTFTAALDDLGIRKFRIPAYWDEIQAKNQDDYDYSALDWQIEEAGKRNATIILAVGYRLPRWPECHLPDWAKNLSNEQKQQDTLNYLQKTIERYKDKKQIVAWQVENEPFLTFFGECPAFSPDFLDKEIALVKKLDSLSNGQAGRPIVVTDSGELSYWQPAAKRADIFGTSIYLHTYSANTKTYIHYPITPGFFHFKKNIVSLFCRPKEWVVIEMQAEPWGPNSVMELSEKDQARTMDLKKFKDILEFGRQAGFKDFYLWGVEWWAWQKEVKNNPVYWDEARKVYNNQNF